MTLNKTMKSVLNEQNDAEVKKMMARLKWNNVPNMFREAQMASLRKVILHGHSKTAYHMLNLQPLSYLTRYRELRLKNGIKTEDKFSRVSFMVSSVKTYGELKLHTYKDKSNAMFKSKLRSRIQEFFGNNNLKNKKKKSSK